MIYLIVGLLALIAWSEYRHNRMVRLWRAVSNVGHWGAETLMEMQQKAASEIRSALVKTFGELAVAVVIGATASFGMVTAGATLIALDNPVVVNHFIGAKGGQAGGGIPASVGALEATTGSGGGGGDLYTNEPAGFITLHENTMQFVVEDSTDWTGNTWESRTDAVTFADATCDGVGDDYTNRHNHPGDGTAQADYGGSFNWTPGVTMDSMYIALCLYVNGTITGGGSNHGIKLDFLRTEDAGGADHFPTWSSSNFFGMHWQSGFSEPDDNTAYNMGAGAEDSPVWFEYLYIASDNGVANGEAHVWIDGVKAYTNTTIDWSDSSSGNCTGSRCGFVGWQMYRNTDEGAGLVQHYLYTSHFYASYKGVAN